MTGITHRNEVPFRTGFTAWGCDSNGRYIQRGGMAGDVNASFPGLHFNPETKDLDYGPQGNGVYPADGGESELRDWAARVFASDPGVDHVVAIVTEQKYQGCSWSQTGRGFRIDRPAA